jgi:hypothetical protein
MNQNFSFYTHLPGRWWWESVPCSSVDLTERKGELRARPCKDMALASVTAPNTAFFNRQTKRNDPRKTAEELHHDSKPQRKRPSCQNTMMFQVNLIEEQAEICSDHSNTIRGHHKSYLKNMYNFNISLIFDDRMEPGSSAY